MWPCPSPCDSYPAHYRRPVALAWARLRAGPTACHCGATVARSGCVARIARLSTRSRRCRLSFSFACSSLRCVSPATHGGPVSPTAAGCHGRLHCACGRPSCSVGARSLAWLAMDTLPAPTGLPAACAHAGGHFGGRRGGIGGSGGGDGLDSSLAQRVLTVQHSMREFPPHHVLCQQALNAALHNAPG